MQKQDPPAGIAVHPNSSKKFTGLICAGVALLVAIVGTVSYARSKTASNRSESAERNFGGTEQRQAEAREKLLAVTNAKIATMMGDSQTQMLGIIRSNRDKAATVLSESKQHENELIGKADEKLQGTFNALRLVECMAEDKVFGTVKDEGLRRGSPAPAHRCPDEDGF